MPMQMRFAPRPNLLCPLSPESSQSTFPGELAGTFPDEVLLHNRDMQRYTIALADSGEAIFTECVKSKDQCHPRRAASIVAMLIFFIGIIASKARFASAPPPAANASISARGVICHERPQRSLHQPHRLSWPPLPTIAFQYRSVSS